MVICMQTAVAHLAAAMGKYTWVFIPKNSQWRYAGTSDQIPWYLSLKVIHQQKRGEWSSVIDEAATMLKSLSPYTETVRHAA